MWLALAVTGGGSVAAEERRLDSPERRIRAGIAELKAVLRSLEANRVAREQAWPTRQRDLLLEGTPPPRVRHLTAAHAELESKKKGILFRIDWEVSRSSELKWLDEHGTPQVGILLDVLEGEDPSLVETIVPTLVKFGKRDLRVIWILEELAAKLDPCPDAVARGLSDSQREHAASFLLGLGLERRDKKLVIAAGNSGVPSVVLALIETAEGEEFEAARLCSTAIRSLVPPDGLKLNRLEGVIALKIDETPSEELRASLITYLGLFANPSHFEFFRHLESSARTETIRLAAIGALGNLENRSAGSYLLERLRDSRSTSAVRRGCIHSLGATEYEPAIPTLIEALEDRELASAAARALRRMTGQRLGDSKSRWLLWWRRQPGKADGAPEPE